LLMSDELHLHLTGALNRTSITSPWKIPENFISGLCTVQRSLYGVLPHL
jgi:ABC-type transporter Mla MlaB component